MQLTPEEIRLIDSSSDALAAANVAATNTFYTNLFTVAPDVRPMFPDEMFEQSRKLWETLSFLLVHLEDLDEAVPALRRLGETHVGYGTRTEHYERVAKVLVDTLERLLAEDWTPDHRRAWERVLQFVCDEMMKGAEKSAN